MNAYRSHTCGQLTATDAGNPVRLSGWVHRVRDHGGVLFIDLRDHYGITQVIADSDSPAFPVLERLRAETVIRIDGRVKLRDASLVNPKLPTGEIEVYATGVEVLGPADELPLPVFGDHDYPEETRLAYRFIDLRRDSLHNNIMLRSRVVKWLRDRMWDAGFTEFQTPIITASSPEGARDFLVPSRLHPGKFYALPQAPQQFKQLIMVAGFDRYFQIAPCFRDEDPRADRSPTDFYQLDVEMSFVEQEDVFAAIQPVIQGLFETFGNGRRVDADWPLIPYAESMLKYGTDKPDLRNPIEMQVVSDHFRGSGFGIFAKLLEQDGTEIRAIPAPGGGSRKFADRMNAFAQQQGLPGMGYIFWRKAEDGATEAAGPIAKALGPEPTEAIRTQLGLGEGDAVFFLGGKPESFEAVAGRARTEIGRELGLIDENQFKFAWIVDFPMYERTDDGKIDFSHNPFSMPQGGLEALAGDPLAVKGYQYDLACNGYELVSGAIRNHKPEIMFKAFELAGYPASEVEKRFGGMVKAFRYGAPPHGGCAAGIDRIVMLLADEQNIREVIMFPMNQRAEDLMMGAPSEPTNEQLRELRLRVLPKDA
ncbi:MAG TPA: aspartate--tRNA ligase [Paracoccus solventivorans]|uniref:Aspartate--tRNA(Asp/Asn) ligase n=1 Tax=Paracoccus solventivorans TaxID=53463 RepID=A0A832QXH4_9RHOB|nr:aspartate--tRNA ligase [Paracoccus solventivorans]HHW34005.1 aspartate--tRNA ligase [Paracoccus solventivorans]